MYYIQRITSLQPSLTFTRTHTYPPLPLLPPKPTTTDTRANMVRYKGIKATMLRYDDKRPYREYPQT
jgi:hypothetical protein